METRLADISEFQQSIDAPAYLKGGNTCLIVRAHNGWRPDKLWPGRRDYLRGFPFVALGWYQYLVSSKDPAQQAREFIAAVGPLRENEFVVCDHEEGAGYQASRTEAWFKVVDQHYGFPATLYAGLSFCNSNLGGWARWYKRPRWLAAYQSVEPREPHDLWQNTDHARFAGLAGGVDGNLFHGTANEFLRKMRPGSVTPQERLPDMAILGTRVAVLNKDGRGEEFILDTSGTLWHRWQEKPGGTWTEGWASLGSP